MVYGTIKVLIGQVIRRKHVRCTICVIYLGVSYIQVQLYNCFFRGRNNLICKTVQPISNNSETNSLNKTHTFLTNSA